MRGLIAACVLAASPAAAFDRMQLAECQNGWLALVDVVTSLDSFDSSAPDDDSAAMRSVRSTLSDDGWCRLTGGTAGLEDAEFDTFDWRAVDIARFINDGAPPLALDLRIGNIASTAQMAPRTDLALTLRQVPGTGMLLIENLNLSDANGAYVALSGVLDGAFFGSKSSTLSSLGGITLQQIAGRINVSPDRIGVLDGGGASQVSNLLDGLDDRQLPPASRAALLAFLQALPDATGRLDFLAKSERGLGWMQIGMAQAFNPDATDAEILGFALSGVTIDATWTPVE